VTLLLSPVEFDTRPALGFRAADRVRSFGAALERARDESFEYRGAYESRGALSLAERSAYGIGDAALHRQARPATLQKPRKIVAPQFQTRTPNVAPVRIRVFPVHVLRQVALRRLASTPPYAPALRIGAGQDSSAAPALSRRTAFRRRAPESKVFRCTAQLGNTRIICIAIGSRVRLAARPLGEHPAR